MPVCSCQSSHGHHATTAGELTPSPVRSALAFGLSFLIAFFPKCPMCWAAYSSSLGIAGVFQVPNLGFLYPVLVGILAVHLLLLFRQSVRVGFYPFFLSVGGAGFLLFSRHYAPQVPGVLNGGIALMLAGSVWHGFLMRRQAKRGHAAIAADSTPTPSPVPGEAAMPPTLFPK